MAFKRTNEHLEPARSILEKLGGPNFVADEILKVNRSIVWRFMYPKHADGRDGWIPREYHDDLLDWARRHKKKLKRRDFHERPELKMAS